LKRIKSRYFNEEKKTNFILDDDNNTDVQTTVETDIDMQLNLYLDPFYSSSTNNNTPTASDLISTLNNYNENEDIWNILEQMSSQTKSDSTSFDSYSSVVPCHTSSMYSSFLPSYPYSSLRTCINRRRSNRRKCYACRQKGHIRKECPYFSHE